MEYEFEKHYKLPFTLNEEGEVYTANGVRIFTFYDVSEVTENQWIVNILNHEDLKYPTFDNRTFEFSIFNYGHFICENGRAKMIMSAELYSEGDSDSEHLYYSLVNYIGNTLNTYFSAAKVRPVNAHESEKAHVSEKYTQYPDGSIYKRRDNHGDWLKVSPWKDGEDRRVYSPKGGMTTVGRLLSKKEALRKINLMFRKYSEEWVYGGARFCVSENLGDIPFADFTKHVFTIRHESIAGVCEKSRTAYVVWHHGSLYWAEPTGKKRLRLYEFRGIDEFPGYAVRWCSISNCKPVMNCDTKQYI